MLQVRAILFRKRDFLDAFSSNRNCILPTFEDIRVYCVTYGERDGQMDRLTTHIVAEAGPHSGRPVNNHQVKSVC